MFGEKGTKVIDEGAFFLLDIRKTCGREGGVKDVDRLPKLSNQFRADVS